MSGRKAIPGPLKRALQKVLVFILFDPGPGGSSVGLPGASGGPPGPKTNQSKKHRNLKELTEQWSLRPCASRGQQECLQRLAIDGYGLDLHLRLCTTTAGGSQMGGGGVGGRGRFGGSGPVFGPVLARCCPGTTPKPLQNDGARPAVPVAPKISPADQL